MTTRAGWLFTQSFTCEDEKSWRAVARGRESWSGGVALALTAKLAAARPLRVTPSEAMLTEAALAAAAASASPLAVSSAAAELAGRTEGRSLLVAVDSRPLQRDTPWTHAAVANAVYASIHGHDFAYVRVPASGCRWQGSSAKRPRRRPTWWRRPSACCCRSRGSTCSRMAMRRRVRGAQRACGWGKKAR